MANIWTDGNGVHFDFSHAEVQQLENAADVGKLVTSLLAAGIATLSLGPYGALAAACIAGVAATIAIERAEMAAADAGNGVEATLPWWAAALGLFGVLSFTALPPAPPVHLLTQPGWRFCSKCTGLWFAGNPSRGICPAGGSHVLTGSGTYAITFAAATFPGQSDWRWCSKCTGLWFAGRPTPGVCPAGAGHILTASGNYALLDNSPSSPGQQNWRWCSKCAGLHYAGSPTAGSCPAGGAHITDGSGDYVLSSS